MGYVKLRSPSGEVNPVLVSEAAESHGPLEKLVAAL
jgi:hypothetical protein